MGRAAGDGDSVGQPTVPPGGQTAFGKTWSWFRSFPVWAQVGAWILFWPLLAALLIASPRNPSRGRFGAAAAVLVVGGVAWVGLVINEPVEHAQELAGDNEAAETGDGNGEPEGAPSKELEEEPSEDAEPEPVPEPEPESTETAEPDAEATPDDDGGDVLINTVGANWTVVNVVDGDTLDVRSADGSEERVRVVGIDTPERGECGYGEASVALADLVMGREVSLVASAQDDRDRYRRLLRYVDVGETDAGLVLVELGLARARYDSRDGYGRHPREDAYVAADEGMPDIACEFAAEPAPEPTPEPTAGAPQPKPEPEPEAEPVNPWGASSCHGAYTPCVPPLPEVGDLNCPDIKAVHSGGVSVDHAHGDPHGLDGDNDGHGCE